MDQVNVHMPEMPAGSVVITPGAMYAEIRQMGAKVDRLATLLDPALATIREDVVDVKTDVADHESRIRSLERKVWVAAGFAAAGGAGLGAALAQLGQAFGS